MSRVCRTLSPSWWCSSAARTTSGTPILLPSWWKCCLSPTLLSSLVLSDSLKWWRTIRCLSDSWSLPLWSSTLVGSASTVILKIDIVIGVWCRYLRNNDVVGFICLLLFSGQMSSILVPRVSSMINLLYGTILALSSRVSGRTWPTMVPSWRSLSEFPFWQRILVKWHNLDLGF